MYQNVIRLLVASGCLASLALSQSQPSFEAGAARRIITPNPLLPLSGGMGPEKPAKGKQGDLMARAIVVRAGGETLAFVSVDLLGITSVIGDRARAKVPRIPKERIVISATHNHSGPDSYAYPNGSGGHTGSLEYLSFVSEQIAAAVNEAYDQLKPAELRVASGEVKGQIAYNYYAPDLYDRRASVLQVREPGGKTIGTLVNYAIHPEVMGSEQGILSPDLVGPLCDRIEAEAGGVAMFVNGAQGGMVTADNREMDKPLKDKFRAVWPDLRAWSECQRIGGLLASESLRLISNAEWQAKPALNAWSKSVTFKVDSNEMWAVLEHSPLKYPHNKENRTIQARVDLINLGGAMILTIPGEALPNIGLYLKRKMGGKHNFLFGLTNEAFGYILTKVDFKSFPRYDSVSRVSLGEMTGEVYIENALAMIRAASPVK